LGYWLNSSQKTPFTAQGRSAGLDCLADVAGCRAAGLARVDRSRTCDELDGDLHQHSDFISVVSTACVGGCGFIFSTGTCLGASLSVLGTPVVAILSSRLILGESFKISEVIGILLIGTAGLVVIISWAASRRPVNNST